MSAATSRWFWFDLLTPDLMTAKAFYGRLFGWTIQVVESDTGEDYHTFLRDGQPFGGMVAMSDDAGVAPHWKAYTLCDTLEGKALAATDMGGEILVPPTDLPGVGRYAAIGDPHGGYFSPLALAPEKRAEARCSPFVWHELRSPDFVVSWAFYRALLDWDKAPVLERDDGLPVQIIRDQGVDVGSVLPWDGLAQWVHYVAVDDLAPAVVAAEKAGATVTDGPHPVPSVRPDAPPLGHHALLQDPTGALFGLCCLNR